MTFKPSDDILDTLVNEVDSDVIKSSTDFVEHFGDHDLENNNISGVYGGGLNTGNVQDLNNSSDLSKILEEKGVIEYGRKDQPNINLESNSEDGFTIDLSDVEPIVSENEADPLKDLSLDSENNLGLDMSEKLEDQDYFNVFSEEVSIDGKLGDKERTDMVSEIVGSIHSNLDFLVDSQWLSVVKKYKKIHHFVFRWGTFVLFVVLGIVVGMLMAKVEGYENIGVEKFSVKNEYNQPLEISSSTVSELSDIGVDVVVPYGFASINGNTFQSKSNLIHYEGLVLPQVVSIAYDVDKMVSLQDFKEGKVSREDLEDVIKLLISNDLIYGDMRNFGAIEDLKMKGQNMEGGLINGFNLKCLFKTKFSNLVCDKFLDTFYMHGKYYDLSLYGSDLLMLVKEIKKQNKNVVPICEMVKDYVFHTGEVDDILSLVMGYCSEKDQQYYKKLVTFIEVDASLAHPEVSDKVFDDPDLNAYKLLSLWQKLYKILDGKINNKGFVTSYLNFVQALINKDKGTYRYLDSLYMNLLYVFNMDELYYKLLKNGDLSSDLKLKLEQINNGSFLLGNESLLSHLTVPNIVVSGGDFMKSDIEERTLEEVFSQYYAMTDRLKIRKVSEISDVQLKVRVEIFSDNILGATENETLKATVSLYRRDNVLYVENINISNQPVFSEVLKVYSSSEFVSFYAMLAYIDEQVGFWYNKPQQDSNVKKTLCERLQEFKDISVYNCDSSSIILYNGSIEYVFNLENGILDSFNISDTNLDVAVKERFDKIMLSRDNTSTIVLSILDFKIEENVHDNVEKKLQVIDQFRIHFKMVPDVYDIEGMDDTFLVNFSIGDEFDFQAYYNIDTHLLTKISYVGCGKTLEIRNLTIEVSANNESELTEILNNPRIFFTRANKAAFKKYQTMCVGQNNGD